MKSVFLYSTDYHLRQGKLIQGELVRCRIGHKTEGLRARLRALWDAVRLCRSNRDCPIYLPRAASKDIWLLYRLFRRRVILISDGISDCMPRLEVLTLATLRVGFARPVSEKFHVSRLEHQQKPIEFDGAGPIAAFTKRGRDFDYVSEWLRNNKCASFSVNPTNGKFSAIYMPASTLAFELAAVPRSQVIIVSCLCSEVRLPASRRHLLLAYEAFLERRGHPVERPAMRPIGEP